MPKGDKERLEERIAILEADRERLRAALRRAVTTVGGGRISHAPMAVYTPFVTVTTVEGWVEVLQQSEEVVT